MSKTTAPDDRPKIWRPRMTKRQFDVFNEYSRYLLVEGCRKSGKSIGILHKIVRHCCENDGAVFAVVSFTKTTAKSGSWEELTKERGGIIDEWISAGMTSWVAKPGHQSDTKTAYCRIRSYNGGESEIQLHSIKSDDITKIEERFKDTNFSGVYIVEADKFKTATIFTALASQLRSRMVPGNRLQMILDTNPPEEGEDHWLFDQFFKNPSPRHKTIHFNIEDNTFLSDDEKQTLYQLYSHDQALLDRYYYGKWVKDHRRGIFSKEFREEFHVIGEIAPEGVEESELLRPHSNCWEIHAGFDLGDVNNAIVIGVPRIIGESTGYDIIDEIVYRKDQRVSLDRLCDEFCEKMDYWENWMRVRYSRDRVRWMFYSDSSSLRFKSSIQSNEATVIYKRTNGRVNLIGVPKGAGSVANRIRMIRRMLFDGHLYVSALCPHMVDCLKYMRRGTGHAQIDPEDPRKHVFDALTYMISYGRPAMFDAEDPTAEKGVVTTIPL